MAQHQPSNDDDGGRCCLTKGIPTLLIILSVVVFLIVNIRTRDDKSSSSDPPQFQLLSISIASFNLSSLQAAVPNYLASSCGGSSWRASISVWNPNKRSRYIFESMQASVAYKGLLPLADAGFPNFKLFIQDSKSIDVVMAPNYNYIHDASNLDLDNLMDSLAWDYRTNATLDFTVVIKGTIYIDWLFLKKGTRSPLEVHCEGLKVGFKSNAGSIVGAGPKECKVHVKFHLWKWGFTDLSTNE